jgi:prevent-host-death family protein
MAMKMMTSREANQDFSRAKREAKSGPVIITERGRPANVLMSYDEYKKLTGKPKSLFDLLSTPAQKEVDFEPPPRQKAGPRLVDLS